MDKAQTLEHILKAQRAWADSRAIQYNRANGRALNLSDNLFSPVNSETEFEFRAADGDELGRRGDPGKMFSLHSSSALVCNVFDYWRRRPLAALVQACGIKGSRNDLRFEQKFPTGLEGTSPNLDLLLSCNGGRPATAIESKFTEPYYPARRKGFSASYFESEGLWTGLAACLSVAKAVGQANYRHVDVPQLLKHILGLRRRFTAEGFELLYLWYDVPGSAAADEHRAEVQRFSEAVSAEVRFRSITYQALFESLLPSVHDTDYAAYLRSRYFRSAVGINAAPLSDSRKAA
ncbi:MAG: hypothetical protein ABSH52_17940 [Terriglobia bacterium]|jgi:hypothetical protein